MKNANRFWIKLLVVFLIFVLTIVLFSMIFKYKVNHTTNNSKDSVGNEDNLGYD